MDMTQRRRTKASLETHLDVGIPDEVVPKIDLRLGPGFQLFHKFLAASRPSSAPESPQVEF